MRKRRIKRERASKNIKGYIYALAGKDSPGKAAGQAEIFKPL
jgi:hypothetical protein